MPITFEEAVAIARERIPEIDNYTEELKAFIFGISGNVSIGGYGSPVAVLKESGECLPLVAYLNLNYPNEVISKGKIEPPHR